MYQGTVFRGGENPILYLRNPGHLRAMQRDTLSFIDSLDRRHRAARPDDSTLEARIASYELAFRMQSSAPEAVDFRRKARRPRSCTASDEAATEDFGRKCLLARRLVERGVRFIQIYSGTNVGDDWDDAHTDLVGISHQDGRQDR